MTTLKKHLNFHLTFALARAKKLQKAFLPFQGATMTQDLIDRLLPDVMKIIKEARFTQLIPEFTVKSKYAVTLRKTLTNLMLNRMFITNVPNELAIFIAGNADLIKAEVELFTWLGQSSEEWAACVVEEARAHTTIKKHIRGAQLDLRILSGSAAGQLMQHFLPEFRYKFFARQLKIIDRKTRITPHYRQFVKTYFLIKLLPADKLGTSEFYPKDSFNKRNKLRGRLRIEYQKHCRIFKPPRVPCHFCHIGLDQCPLGTHQFTFNEGNCCNKHRGFVERENGVCLNCQQAQWKRFHA